MSILTPAGRVNNEKDGVEAPMPNRKMEIGRGNRKHKHWRVTLIYNDDEIFGRVFINRDKAESYAARQKKSPLVKNARIEPVE